MAKTKIEMDVPSNELVRKPTAKKTFSLENFKKDIKMDKGVKFKKRKWLPIKNVLGKSAFCEATGLQGVPANDVVNIIGHTDSGKSSLLLEIAYSCQKNNVLPVFIITELKFAWEHLKTMGLEFVEEALVGTDGEAIHPTGL